MELEGCSMITLFIFSFLAGFFTALSPCILPVLPAILSAGVAGGRLRPLGTIVGLICSFTFFTLLLTWLIRVTGFSPSILRYIAIALIFFFGLVMIFPRLSNWFAKVTTPMANLGQKIQSSKPKDGFWGGVVFGLALGLLWTPCAGPILGAITTLVASQTISSTVVIMTLLYSVGAGIPLFFFAYGSAKLIKTSRLLSRYTEGIRQFFGVLMIGFALLLTFNWDMLISQKLSQFFPQWISEKNFHVEVQNSNSLPNDGKAPELVGIEAWINSPPLTLSELKGKVVLVDFWTYSCINCLRTIPHLENWYQDYKDKGFVIIGVHTPEFVFERELENVKKAVHDLGITYPVALDNNYATWNAYQNQYWPAHFLIDQEGVIRMEHFGEGEYTETENGIRMLLGMSPLNRKDEAVSTRPTSPETYLGLSRGRSYKSSLSSYKTANYRDETSSLKEDEVGLKGPWLVQDEHIQSKGVDSDLELNFLSAKVYLVLGGSNQTPLEILLDGKPYGTIDVDGDKKYNIVSTSYGRHLLSLKVPQGIRAYAFTFGDE
jgi:cytochrome c biogenesis protein CcdA/thiol-disulfide isomerase/thioredoxin